MKKKELIGFRVVEVIRRTDRTDVWISYNGKLYKNIDEAIEVVRKIFRAIDAENKTMDVPGDEIISEQGCVIQNGVDGNILFFVEELRLEIVGF